MNDLLDPLISDYSNKALKSFFRRKNSSFRPIEQSFEYELENYNDFSNLKKLGEVEYDNMEELLVFSCRYIGVLTERSSKKKQFEIAKKVLREDFKDGAVFVFYDESGKFRFSFIRKHFGKEKKKYTNWKRFTYFVDPDNTNRTFKQRIGACSFSSLDEILEAFSVEPLNKEFYQNIVRQFYSLVGGEVGTGRSKEKLSANLTLPGRVTDRNIVRQFGVRLVGRIIFCWFLKHKSSKQGVPLIPDDWLSSKTIGQDYYHGKLEKLFFEILNKKLKDRSKLLPNEHEVIPFLNGGLFEPQRGKHKDYYDSQSNYALKISDDWFVELFEVLEQYNFTIDENSVNDAEVSIDPEMLGRIFENLLAEIDPNLKGSEKTSIRRATGSYYTPREIVDYMVEEALVRYLHNKTELDQPRLHTLFADSEDDVLRFTQTEREILIDAFDQVKILDPAAGSGAFPMGALHKIITALEIIDPGAKRWKEKQLESITNAGLKAEMSNLLARANAEYSRKLGVLQKCIYGADIQPIAAEISRLRSFLSLIVDEEINDSIENRGIIALPNLEFKFVTANTLNGLSNSGSLETEKVSGLMPQLQRIRLDYLQSHGEEKKKLQKKFRQIQDVIFNDQMKINPDMESRPMQLASWNPFKNEETDWFDPHWMFGVDQFDIIVGNPPYGGKKISNNLKNELGLKSKDPYGAFIGKYLRNRNEKTALKHNGILSFIVSDTFMSILSHKKLRKLILQNRIHSMIRVHPDTFNATVNTAIIICERLEKKAKVDKVHVLAVDFTSISINNQYEKFTSLLQKLVEYNLPEFSGENYKNDNILYMRGKDWSLESSTSYGIYKYPQDYIEKIASKSFFVASPKLQRFLNNKLPYDGEVDLNLNNVRPYLVQINGRKIPFIKLGDISEVKDGMTTGDNDFYLYQNPQVRGNYRDISKVKERVFTEKDIELILNDEKLRKKTIKEGISKDNSIFSGRYIVPYDKGGESNTNQGWLPNYFVPTNYFIDWSTDAVRRMHSLTIADRIRINDENKEIKKHYETTLACVKRNSHFYFKRGLTYSRTGIYSPSFRLSSFCVYDVKGAFIDVQIDLYKTLAILSSKLVKAISKSVIYHVIDLQVDALKSIPISLEIKEKVKDLCLSIISKQKNNPKYDYSSNEQLEVDYLIYQAYGLSWQDVREIEYWYERRYPKLVLAQKKNLTKIGKPTDYITIYKSLVEAYGDLEN